MKTNYGFAKISSIVFISLFLLQFNLFSKEQGGIVQYSNKIDSIEKLPVTDVSQVVRLLPSVVLYENITVISGLQQQNFLKINGIDFGDPIFGGVGPADYSKFPFPSLYAFDSVELTPADFSGSNFNNLGASLNLKLKKGNTEKYEVFAHYTGTISGLYGSTSNDYDVKTLNGTIQVNETSNGRKLQSSGDRSIDVGIGGPLKIIDNATFFISYRNFVKEYDGGLEVYDPANNNLGQMPYQNTNSNNFTASLNFKLFDDISFEINGMYGISSWLDGNWDNLYLTDRGLYNSVTEGEAKTSANNYKNSFLNLKIANNQDSKISYKIELGISKYVYEHGRRKSFSGTNLLDGYDILEPEDNYKLRNGEFVSGYDGLLDQYEIITKYGYSKDSIYLNDFIKRNPISGYYESFSSSYFLSSDNPYGISNFFCIDEPDIMLLNLNKYSASAEVGYKYQLYGTDNQLCAGLNYSTYNYDKYIAQIYSNNYYINSDTYTAGFAHNITEENKKYYEPLKPNIVGAFIQNNFIFSNFYANIGLRYDYFNSNYYSIKYSFSNLQYSETSSNQYLSPRINLSYKFNKKNSISFGYGKFYMMPDFNTLFNYCNSIPIKGSMCLSNPSLEPIYNERTQLSYTGNILNGLGINISVYNNYLANGIDNIYIPDVPTPYYLLINELIRKSYGFEVNLQKKLTDNFFGSINYAYSNSKSNAFNKSENNTFILIDLGVSDYNVPHKLNLTLNYSLYNDEGIKVFGIKPFENLNLTLISRVSSGYPYTKINLDGSDGGAYNGERLPASYFFDFRLSKKIYFNGSDTKYSGKCYVAFSIDIFNLFNSRFETLNDYNFKRWKTVNSMRKELDFSSVNYYKKAENGIPESYSTKQYDDYGNRRYNSNADFDNDGVVTQHETFEAYSLFMQDVLRRQTDVNQLRKSFFRITVGF